MKKINFYLAVCAVGIASFFVGRNLRSMEKTNDHFVFSRQVCGTEEIDENTELNQICPPQDPEVERVQMNQELAENAISLCFHGRIPKNYKVYGNALTLLETEDENEVPSAMKGMTLAAACVESGFSEKAEGDHRFSKDKKTPMAIGILQLWPLYEKAYKVNRRDVRSSANGWLGHIKKQIKYVKSRCKTKDEEQTWKVAWVTGVRAPKAGGRCNETVVHWHLFKRIKASTIHI